MSIRKRTWKSNGSEQAAWVVDYVDQHDKRRLKTFALKKDAEAWATNARHEVSQGLHAPNSKVTIEETVTLWIRHSKDEGLERGTIEQRAQHLRLHITPFIGREKLATMTTPRLNTFLDQLRDAGRSVAMRRKILTSVRSALAFVRGRVVAQNVASGIKVKSDDRHKATGPLRAGRNFPLKSELNLLIDRAPERWRPFIVTAIFTGMRASELRGLRWTDVDLDAGTIHVAQRADKWGALGSPKSAAGARDIPLTPMVINTLRQWKLACPAGELVFANGNGRAQSHATFSSRVWKPLQQKCGIPHYEFHSLRHAAASLFIETLRWSPKRVQAIMGHSSIAMTYDHYGHLFADTEGDKEAMKRLEAAVVAAR